MAYELGLAIPFFGKPEECQVSFYNWLGNKKTIQRFKSLGIDMDEITFEFGRPGDVLETQGLKFGDVVPKGVCITRLIDELRINDPKTYICIDGEGINFDYVFDLMIAFQTFPIYASIACRKGKFGLDNPKRELAERFELFVLSNIFDEDLPDGQCGCWGFKKEILHKLDLSAKGFEIELDFLIRLFQERFPFCFIPVEVKPGKSKLFKEKDHLMKLEFIAKKTYRGRYELLAFLEEFERKENAQLFESYKDHINKIKVSYPSPPIHCLDSCDLCKHGKEMAKN